MPKPDLEPWRKLVFLSGQRAFDTFLSQTAQAGIWFTQAQQEQVQVLCMVATSQGMRELAAAPDREALIAAINADTAATPLEG